LLYSHSIGTLYVFHSIHFLKNSTYTIKAWVQVIVSSLFSITAFGNSTPLGQKGQPPPDVPGQQTSSYKPDKRQLGSSLKQSKKGRNDEKKNEKVGCTLP
jgi:hypothetical protein